ncbi:hypothetical protein [Dawidia soli]|uniref:Lipoprotein n=1 Tax=Dawidia soli TaxID=2782352 RepID=A0AAP2GEN4_9BACT|nr:hypothetical protein [Dawidia soli]MBT1688567.1 hypothetical protein [Dawidia soli]
MKRILVFLLPAMVAIACEEKAGGYEVDNGCGLELKLVKMTSSWTGDESIGAKLEWQETIVLSNDSTFLKRRNHDGTTYEAAGRYAYVTYDDRRYVELTYDPRENNIRTSCLPNELIEVTSSRQYKNISWQACDGPVLEYEAHAARCGE